MSVRSRSVIVVAAMSLVCALVGLNAPAVAAAPPALLQTDLKVLVVSNSNTAPLEDMLSVQGVPFQRVDLGDGGRPTITAAFLADTSGAAPRAKFQGIVLPNAAGGSLSSSEMAALNTYSEMYGIRQASAYNYPDANIGLNPPTYSGKMDGKVGQVSAVGLTGAFQYLVGTVPFDDVDPTADESYGYVSTVRTDLAAGTTVEPLLTADGGVVMGIHRNAQREQLFLTFIANSGQTQMKLIGPGIVEWLTNGTHLGLSRNFLAVHADDILNADARWSSARNCTPGEDCPIDDPATPGVIETEDMIMMSPDDVTALIDWQGPRVQIDMAYNAYPADNDEFPGTANLTSALLGAKSSLRWINHTYNHLYFGCVQYPDPPYDCTTQPVTDWAPKDLILDDIQDNITWATANGVTIDATELISGEHSGLADTNPGRVQSDNANFLAALADAGIEVVASDASKESDQRQAGPAVTLPRYPNSLFYNVGTQGDLVDEYNWIYGPASDPEGNCTAIPNVTTCMTTLLGASGFTDYISPFEARQTLGRVLSNDPRPHFVHQSNLAEDRLTLTWLGHVIDGAATFPNGYKDLINASNTPLVNPTMTEAALALTQQGSWAAAQSDVTAYAKGGQVVVTNQGGSPAWVPLSAATGTLAGTATPVGEPYMGTRSEWQELAAGASLTIDIAPNVLPTASFTVDASADPAVTVTSTSTDADGTILSYLWDFGDGATSTVGPQVTHTYGAPGDYTITLTTTDNRAGVSSPTRKSVTITKANTAPVASIGVSCTDLECTVDGTASSDPDGDVPLTYAWTFGDGTQASGSQVAHTYPSAGDYQITLVVTDSRGQTSAPAATTVSATAPPNKDPQAAFTATCADLTCGFNASASSDSDGKVTSYQWSFGDGTTGTGINPLGHVFPGAGEYAVTLTVVDNEGGTGRVTRKVTVKAPAVVPPAVTPPAVTPPAVVPPAVTPPAVTPPVTAPPAVAPPTTSAPVPTIKIKAVKRKGKLRVNVNPNKGKRFWKLKVQKLKKDGTWKQYKKTYRTKGKKEKRTINRKKGTYRVKVLPKFGYDSATSATIRLKR